MANEKTPVVWDDTTSKHRPLGTGEKMGGLDASSLLSSDSGNLLEAGSDGLAYLSGSGMVDPRADNLLEDSANGKLQVTIDRIAEWLDGHPQDAAVLADAINAVSGDEGNVITAGSDNGAFLSKGAIAAAVAGMTDAQKAQLADAIAARIASDIADGKTIVASGGKLTSDPTNATAAQKKAINQALADSSSGLVVDNSTGKLQVDFSQMPTDKFETLLKGLKMQIPLTASKNLYVNGATGTDDSSEGRGESVSKPFKTISACVSYATQTYAVGPYTIYINVEGGQTYYESVNLPMFTRTTGFMVLRARDYASPPTIVGPAGSKASVPLGVAGGTWYLQRINVSAMFSAPDDSVEHFPGCLHVGGAGTTAIVQGCSFTAAFNGEAHSNYFEIRMLGSFSGATLVLGVLSGYHNSLTLTKGNASRAHFLHAENASKITFPANNAADSGDMYHIVCSGSCTFFANASMSSQMYAIGGASNYQHFSGTVAGAQYSITNGSNIAAPVGGFPGAAEGVSLDANTYCWYKTTGY